VNPSDQAMQVFGEVLMVLVARADGRIEVSQAELEAAGEQDLVLNIHSTVDGGWIIELTEIPPILGGAP
jgi:hypothetical protein